MKGIWTDFFRIRRSDMRAVVALACIAVLCAIVLVVIKVNRNADKSETADAKTESKIDGEKGTKENNQLDGNSSQAVLHEFDPNEVDSATLITFGLTPYKVKTFIRYRAAGATFPTAESMGRTYGWTEEDVQRLAPYVRVGEQYKKKGNGSHDFANNNGKSYDRNNDNNHSDYSKGGRSGDNAEHSDYERVEKFTSKRKLDINTIDSVTLRKVPGVGEKTCSAIIRKRERLGGFVSTSQLLEISIVSPELLEWFSVSPSTANIRKINVNKASFHVLNSHPYISYDQTRSLLDFRRIYGNIDDEKTLVGTNIFLPEELEKLRPYLEY